MKWEFYKITLELLTQLEKSRITDVLHQLVFNKKDD
jgi:hypothetical protein